MGTDMISCDSEHGGLFHKRCVAYDDTDKADDSSFWYCGACDRVRADESEDDPHFVPVELGAPTVTGIRVAVETCISEIPMVAMIRGFETRKAIARKIIQANGGNNFSNHFRTEENRDHLQ
jgi:hypothetical protein